MGVWASRSDLEHGVRVRGRALRGRVSRTWFVAALACLFSGCAEEWGPTPTDVVDIEGRLRVRNEPVRGGWVEFLPVDGALGTIRSAPIGRDGSFRATRVARGHNVVRVVYPPPFPPVNRLYQRLQTPLRVVIEAGKPVEIDLSLPPRLREAG